MFSFGDAHRASLVVDWNLQLLRGLGPEASCGSAPMRSQIQVVWQDAERDSGEKTTRPLNHARAQGKGAALFAKLLAPLVASVESRLVMKTFHT